jgi:hypothetical protein
MDRVYKVLVHGLTDFIKCQPSKIGSTIQILSHEGVYFDLIVLVASKMDDQDLKDRSGTMSSNLNLSL